MPTWFVIGRPERTLHRKKLEREDLVGRNLFCPLSQFILEKGSLSCRLQGPGAPIEPFHPLLLEQFVHHNVLADAFKSYCQASALARKISVHSIHDFLIETPSSSLLLVNRSVLICPPDASGEAYRIANLKSKAANGLLDLPADYLAHALNQARIQDLSKTSRERPIMSHLLIRWFLGEQVSYPSLSLDDFCTTVEFLSEQGLLVPPFGTLDFGDFGHTRPLCTDYGFSRGMPLDRFYLTHFVAEIRRMVVGSTLEIGGRKENKDIYGFNNTTEYLIMDLEKDGGPDILGDAHVSTVNPESRFDSIILFNVLEHCEEPWTVVGNVYRWLRKGGMVFAAVPTAQRIHRDPKDCWRILPDGMVSLFKKFEIVMLRTYGNLSTVQASFSGVAAEELGNRNLVLNHPLYPVICCISARKKGM